MTTRIKQKAAQAGGLSGPFLLGNALTVEAERGVPLSLLCPLQT